MGDVDEIKDRLDIVDVVSDYVALKKAGQNFKSLCPFHEEKTASFIVNPGRQNWRCFGSCGTGGDTFSFVMKMENIGFGEALKLLAQKAGIPLKERRGDEATEILYKVNYAAANFYQRILIADEGQQGRNYLLKRGIDSTTAAEFELGLSPWGGSHLTNHLRGLGFNVEYALNVGLVRRGEDGALHDFFRNRLMFPVHDKKGRVVGFGGRSLDGSEPKYINTIATPIFDKQSILYGLHKSVASIREQGMAVIVEGYMDVIAAHQYAYTNVVASMGTALTERQISLLKSVTKEFVQALDPDSAGQEATRRSLESSYRVMARQLGQKSQLNLKVVRLPAGCDPDELIREDSKQWGRLVREAIPFMEFALPAFARKYDLKTAQGKAQAAEELLPLLTATTNAFEQDQNFDMLADILNVDRQTLEASIGRLIGGTKRKRSTLGRPARAASLSPISEHHRDILEDYVLALLLTRPQSNERAQNIPVEHFSEAGSREIFSQWLICSTIDNLWDMLDEGLHDRLERIVAIDIDLTSTDSLEAALDQSLRRLEQRYLRGLQEALLSSGDSDMPPPRELEVEIVNVNARLRELFPRRN